MGVAREKLLVGHNFYSANLARNLKGVTGLQWHKFLASVRSALLGGSGGMPPQENLGLLRLFLMQFQVKIAGVCDPSS